MTDLPDFLASGERARLFPVLADTSKEGRTLSIFLSCLCAVDELSRAMMASIGQRLGTRARLDAYTEVVFKTAPSSVNHRPDGLLVVTTGKRRWSALVEAKIGRNEIVADQVTEYAQLARSNNIDAVITLSNQFVAVPDHHPVSLSRGLAKSVQLYHWSWMSVATQASLLLSEDVVSNGDQKYILSEFQRFLSHQSAGVAGFDRMNSEWRTVVSTVQTGGKLSRSSPEIENTVASWHQETKDLCLIMSRILGRETQVGLSRAHTSDPVQRLKADCESLANTAALNCELDVPDAAAPISVRADLRTRTVTARMKLAAPGDKKSTKARVSWLLRQLGRSDPKDLHVRALWPGRAPPTQASLADLKADWESIESVGKTMAPTSFEVLLVRDLGAKFSGNKTFIELLEDAVPAFYEQAGQHLRAWQPAAPKVKDEARGEEAFVPGEANVASLADGDQVHGDPS